jgi:hypothetical protein
MSWPNDRTYSRMLLKELIGFTEYMQLMYNTNPSCNPLLEAETHCTAWNNPKSHGVCPPPPPLTQREQDVMRPLCRRPATPPRELKRKRERLL